MRSRRWSLVSVPSTLALVLALPPAVAAAPPATCAWVVARQPTAASDTPAARDQGNSSGGTNTVERTATGSYTVTMPGVINSFEGGHVQVSALGAARYCTVTGWSEPFDNVKVSVSCHLFNGTLADSAFSAVFLTRGSASGTIAYVWANQESATDYTPSPDYQWPGDITIHRSGTGQYEVRLPGFDATLLHLDIQVTGYGDRFCRAAGAFADGSDTLVGVRCPAGDAKFDLLLLSNVGPTGVARPKAAYAYVRPLESGAARFPADRRYSSAGTTPTLTRSGVGQYLVTLPGMPRGGMALVNALGAGDLICYLSQIRRGATPQKVGVRCAHSDGSPVDTNFSLAYSK